MKVVLFGSSGLLGSAVEAELARRGYAYHCFSRNGAKKVDSSNDSQSLLIENHEQVTREMFDLWPDAIVNCAAVSSPDQVSQNPAAAHLVNVEGPLHLAEVASHLGARFLHISTDMVFDGSSSPYRSTDQPNPLSEYGRQKLEAEKSILSVTDENLVVLRITLLNGNSPGGMRSQHEKILHALAKEEPMVLFEDEVRQPCSTENVASAIVELLERPNLNGLFHWAGDEEISRYELGVRILERFGIDPGGIKKGSLKKEEERVGVRPAHLSFELSPLLGKLKTNPPSVEKQLESLIIPPALYEWYREHADDPSRYVPRFSSK